MSLIKNPRLIFDLYNLRNLIPALLPSQFSVVFLGKAFHQLILFLSFWTVGYIFKKMWFHLLKSKLDIDIEYYFSEGLDIPLNIVALDRQIGQSVGIFYFWLRTLSSDLKICTFMIARFSYFYWYVQIKNNIFDTIRIKNQLLYLSKRKMWFTFENIFGDLNFLPLRVKICILVDVGQLNIFLTCSIIVLFLYILET